MEPGQTLSHYRIESQIGKGGMGTVFLAEDTKLGRKVALKVLPPALASDEDRLARFQREAKAVAALNHPNIVTLYSVEEEDGVHFITMELVKGQTLTELLPRNGFTLSQLLVIALPLADAVSSAHRAGITHRDLKPDNIMIDSEGRLRVLDFGLAKLQGPAGPPGDTKAETAAAVTEEGKILGTVAYMSPEQAEGKNVDPRSDVFSLGTVLYEMAAGERPFRGETSMSTIGAILKDQPTPITELNRALPRHVGRIIHRCLAKDPDRRYQSALDLRNELEGLKAEIDSGLHDAEDRGAGGATATTSRRKPFPAWQMALAGLGLIAALAAVYFLWPRAPETSVAPASIRPLTSMAGIEGDPTWSPDGTFLAFWHFPGPASLFIVPTAGGDPVPLVGSEAVDFHPRWSPDSRWIAFVSNRNGRSGIFLVPPLGGQVQRLADINMRQLLPADGVGALGGIPWSPDGERLLFSRQASDGSIAIWAIELDSRRETQRTHPGPGVQDLWASWTFDGSRIVFSRDGNLWLLIPGGDPQALLEDEPVEGRLPTWMPDGERILFQSNRSGSSDLWEIDAVSGSLRQITMSPNNGIDLAVSRDGRIAYAQFSHEQDLYLVSLEEGSHERLTSHTGWNQDARISPDGTRIAYVSLRTGDWEIWIIDRATGNETQLASHPATDVSPTWSPDGKQVAFVSDRDGKQTVWVVNADGSGGPRLLTEEAPEARSGAASPTWTRPSGASNLRWSPDGAAIGFVAPSERGPALYELDLETGSVTLKIYNIAMFDWYLDRERVIYTPIPDNGEGRMEMRVANLRTGKEKLLLEGPHTMASVTRDGLAVAFCRAATHNALQLYYLKLRPPAPDSADGLPTPEGQPVQLTDGYGDYHVHNGGWSPDGREIVYTRDLDAGDIYVIEPRKPPPRE
jgi:Tol biopolymer transport system component/predicted Ser/Thr protein kinase